MPPEAHVHLATPSWLNLPQSVTVACDRRPFGGICAGPRRSVRPRGHTLDQKLKLAPIATPLKLRDWTDSPDLKS
jgi:hypothetical protein